MKVPYAIWEITKGINALVVFIVLGVGIFSIPFSVGRHIGFSDGKVECLRQDTPHTEGKEP